MALRAAYWAMHRRADALMARHGVTADQYVLLSLLAERDGVTQQELVRRAASDANTVRAMLVRLEEQGLVSRRPHPTDGRARSVRLTAGGRRAHERLTTAGESFRRRLLAALERGAAAGFARNLKRVAESMAPAPARPRRGSHAVQGVE